jgi:hypothetical protein
MKKVLLIVLFFSFTVFAQTNETLHAQINKEDNGHTFSLSISKKLFNSKDHDLSKIQFNTIDNDTAFGIDGSLPKYEISKINLEIDDKYILIPKDFYKRFYNPSLEYDSNYKNIDAFFNNDYQTIILLMNASDGAGAYPLVLLLNKNGNHSFIKMSMEDIYFNFFTN